MSTMLVKLILPEFARQLELIYKSTRLGRKFLSRLEGFRRWWRLNLQQLAQPGQARKEL